VTIGLFWTAVVVEVDGSPRCGLAATMSNDEFEHARQPAVTDPGHLEQQSALELANLVFSESHTEAAVGLAAINAMLPPIQNAVDLAAEDYIAHQGIESRVALIGHFPFVARLRDQVKELWVLELNPKDGDLPASAAPEVIPQADILAITATTLINHTFESIFKFRKPGARVLLLGPSTPLSPILFDHGIDVLSGTIVYEPDAVLPLVRQGATFRQIRKQGVRLVTLESPR
jgi:uncharacterized protein (DUF4213/DUF364 family)